MYTIQLLLLSTECLYYLSTFLSIQSTQFFHTSIHRRVHHCIAPPSIKQLMIQKRLQHRYNREAFRRNPHPYHYHQYYKHNHSLLVLLPNETHIVGPSVVGISHQQWILELRAGCGAVVQCVAVAVLVVFERDHLISIFLVIILSNTNE